MNVKTPGRELPFDIAAIRRKAREHIDQGAVTAGYQAKRSTLLELLDDSLATEIVCVLRYKRHAFLSAAVGGIPGYAVTAELAKHAEEEMAHADKIATRMVQLGGTPNFDPASLVERSHADYVAGDTLEEMLREDLVAERIAIDVYGSTIRYVGDSDPTTRRMLEQILEQEEEHADELSDYLRRLGATPKKDQ